MLRPSYLTSFVYEGIFYVFFSIFKLFPVCAFGHLWVREYLFASCLRASYFEIKNLSAWGAENLACFVTTSRKGEFLSSKLSCASTSAFLALNAVWNVAVFPPKTLRPLWYLSYLLFRKRMTDWSCWYNDRPRPLCFCIARSDSFISFYPRFL